MRRLEERGFCTQRGVLSWRVCVFIIRVFPKVEEKDKMFEMIIVVFVILESPKAF
jgi:hypothetical protein